MKLLRFNFSKLAGFIWRKECKHEFVLDDLRRTGIPELEKPTTNSYEEWSRYFSAIYTHDSYTKRVMWPCAKCGKVFYAHYGIAISPTHGPVVRRNITQQVAN